METRELRGKKQQRVFDKITFFHIAEDENNRENGFPLISHVEKY